MTVHVLSAAAPAKINLTLEVTGRRDDGYHTLSTILQTLSLSDEVTVRLAGEAPGVLVSGPFAEGTPADASNLAWRAAAALAELTNRSCDGLGISIQKQIPPAGGLGGGASDAATTLRLLQPVWGASDGQLLKAASAVGSDEAALVLGGRVHATGRGDVVRVLPDGPKRAVVLFAVDIGLVGKTGRLFRALTEHELDSGEVTEAALLDPGRLWTSAGVFNSFEMVAFDVFPGLAELRDDLKRRVGDAIRLAGAGPTLFWMGSPDACDDIIRRASGAGCKIIPAETAESLWKPF